MEGNHPPTYTEIETDIVKPCPNCTYSWSKEVQKGTLFYVRAPDDWFCSKFFQVVCKKCGLSGPKFVVDGQSEDEITEAVRAVNAWNRIRLEAHMGEEADDSHRTEKES